MVPLLMILALGAGVPGQAADASTATAKPTKTATAKADDPITCETSGELGSLIRKKRVCMHRSEWEAQRASDRMEIERGQVQVPVNGGG